MSLDDTGFDCQKVDEFISAWTCGRICLHPTDTIPGLSFNPKLLTSKKQFFLLKKREPAKPSICLVANTSIALSYWESLPSIWAEKLSREWPSGLSIIWKASSRCLSSLTSAENELALRVPSWGEEDRWMQLVLERLACPFPTSSVNFAGQPAAVTWEQAVSFVKALSEDTFVPDFGYETNKLEGYNEKRSSTLIRILVSPSSAIQSDNAPISADVNYEILRDGLLSREKLDHWLRS